MKHNDFKAYLSGDIWTVMEEEIADHTRHQMIRLIHEERFELMRDEVIRNLEWRWFQTKRAMKSSLSGRQIQRLIQGVLLHKYGWATQEASTRAVAAAKYLSVISPNSKDLEIIIPKLEELLSTPCEMPSRRPVQKTRITQYHKGDLLAIAYNKKFYCAYVLEILRDEHGDFEQIEFYESVFDSLPDPSMLKNCSAKAFQRKDGLWRARCSLCGLPIRPDPAAQMVVLASNYLFPPLLNKIQTDIDEEALTPLFELRQFMDQLFLNS